MPEKDLTDSKQESQDCKISVDVKYAELENCQVSE